MKDHTYLWHNEDDAKQATTLLRRQHEAIVTLTQQTDEAERRRHTALAELESVRTALAVSQARCREMERALHVTSWLGAHATEIVRALKAACAGPECCCGDDTDSRCGVCQSRIVLSTLEAA